MCEELEICRHFSTLYYLQANEQVEGGKKILKIIQKMLDSKGLKTDELHKFYDHIALLTKSPLGKLLPLLLMGQNYDLDRNRLRFDKEAKL